MNLPPQAPRHPHTILQPGPERADEYYWLRFRENPEVLAYLLAENAYAQAEMAATVDLQQTLAAEMRARIAETDHSVPVVHGRFEYYSRQEAGRQYPIHCRRPAGQTAESVLLDVNALAAGQAYCRVGVFEVSPDHRWLAYSVDFSGDEAFTLRIKDLETGGHLPEAIPNTSYGLAWANDSRTLFYTTLDEARRPDRVWRHRCGAPAGADVLVHHESDAAFAASVRAARSRRYVFIDLRSNRTDECRFAPADQPEAAFAVFAPRARGVEYTVDHHLASDGAERFFILTNADAENFRLLEAPAGPPEPARWREVLPHRADVLLEGLEVFQDQVAVFERQGGQQRIWLADPANLAGGHTVPVPEPVCALRPGDNPAFDSDRLRFTYSSLATPNTVVDYAWRSRTWSPRKQDPIPSGYDPSRYRTERLTATASDGTAVPLSLVCRTDVPRDGSAPCVLAGYGAYGVCLDAWFDSKRLSLLDRGVVFVIAHVRGGGELGRAWYQAGKLLNKRNSFTDLIAAAEHLIAQGLTRPERLALLGTSAGGLLVSAAATMRPELFRCVVARVPFVDVVTSMGDPAIPLTVGEWEEWGNPSDPAQAEYMRSYSPYDNLRPGAYPAMLVTAGLNDPRVPYWEPAKFTARLRAVKTDDRRLLLKTNLGAGHGGSSGRFDSLSEAAFEYAFLLRELGAA